MKIYPIFWLGFATSIMFYACKDSDFNSILLSKFSYSLSFQFFMKKKRPKLPKIGVKTNLWHLFPYWMYVLQRQTRYPRYLVKKIVRKHPRDTYSRSKTPKMSLSVKLTRNTRFFHFVEASILFVDFGQCRGFLNKLIRVG